MRWGNHLISFIRPVHWVALLYGKEIVHTTLLGKKTSRETQGHRFHHTKPLSITQPKDYQQLNNMSQKQHVPAQSQAYSLKGCRIIL